MWNILFANKSIAKCWNVSWISASSNVVMLFTLLCRTLIWLYIVVDTNRLSWRLKMTCRIRCRFFFMELRIDLFSERTNKLTNAKEANKSRSNISIETETVNQLAKVLIFLLSDCNYWSHEEVNKRVANFWDKFCVMYSFLCD